MFNVCSYLFRLFCLMAAAYAVLLIPSRLFDTVHWGGIEPNLHLYIGFAFFFCVGAFKVVRQKEPRLEARQLWSYLCGDYPWLKLLNFVHTAFLLCCLMVVSGPLADTAGRVCAYCFDFAGQYELAERVYSRTANRTGYSFASVSGRGYLKERLTYYTTDELVRREKENEVLDRAVENVYGANSLQMALRYRSHAVRLEDYEKEAVLFKKSIAIFRHLNAHAECLTVLALLANVQLELGDIAGLVQSLSEISRLVSIDSALSENTSWAMLRSPFERAVKSGVNVTEACKQFEARHLLASKIVHVSQKVDCTVALMLLFCIVLLPTLFVSKKILLSAARNRWQQQLRHGNSPIQFIERSDRLVMLELYSGNIARADSYSRHSLLAAQQANF